MNIETRDLRTISEADARATMELVCTIWPKPGRTVDAMTADLLQRWKQFDGLNAQYPRSFFVREAGRIIAHATAVPRTIATRAGNITVLALSRVCTDPAVRGRHLGQAMARAAFESVDNGAYPFSLFQTTDNVKSFYEQLGAIEIRNRFIDSTAEDPTASPWWSPVVMRYPAKPGWPEGEIDLRGPGW
jgi:predicted GNAT family N-acyltransferase